jgi:predicted transporter
MVVHLTMAGVMAVWGIYLLVHPVNSHSASRAWLLMTVPCPVCFSVILISAAFGISLFPDRALWIVPALYLSFMLIGMVTMGISHWRRGDGRNPPEHLSGGLMVMLAAYFFISITVMPQIGDLDKIYRMASYHESAPANHSAAVAPTLLATAAAFAVGCGTTLIKIRRLR